MSNICLILVVFELHLEAEGVVKTAALALHAVLIVADLISLAHPTDILPLRCRFGVNERLLALII
jgi:hypothetical protein